MLEECELRREKHGGGDGEEVNAIVVELEEDREGSYFSSLICFSLRP